MKYRGSMKKPMLKEGSSLGYFTVLEMLVKRNIPFSLRIFLLLYPLLSFIKR
ncbi:MAG TPA: hypothetical protein VJC07_05455 [Candidatus Nanoarchaeia archaeon]|nr:hypothetical protein [Candidatus Nanoarchaeia archaeon]